MKFKPSFNQKIQSSFLDEKEISLFLKREDLIHPEVSGNKFRKLKYNLKLAKAQGKTKLLSFGGAYSNHIAALAAAGKIEGFSTIGVIRGEELGGGNLQKTLEKNTTLQKAVNDGMQLYFISRSLYRQKHTYSFLMQLQKQFGSVFIIPEGGTNALAVRGCEEILDQEDFSFDYICCSCATAGTFAGLVNASSVNQKLIGFSALKENFLETQLSTLVRKKNWSINRDFHFGGYAKINTDLIAFINRFYIEQKIPLDPVYTSKMMYGIFEQIRCGKIPRKSRILAIHTGGLQGIDVMNKRLKYKNQPLIQFYD